MEKKYTSKMNSEKKYGGRMVEIHKFDYIDK